MSTRLILPKPSIRQRNLQWMNMLAHIHDTNCDCYNPLEHTIILILEQEKELKFKAPRKRSSTENVLETPLPLEKAQTQMDLQKEI